MLKQSWEWFIYLHLSTLRQSKVLGLALDWVGTKLNLPPPINSSHVFICADGLAQLGTLILFALISSECIILQLYI